MSWKFTDESSVTFQSSVSGPGEFGLSCCKTKKKKNHFQLENVRLTLFMCTFFYSDPGLPSYTFINYKLPNADASRPCHIRILLVLHHI